MMSKFDQTLLQIEQFLTTHVKPIANELDNDYALLAKTFEQFKQLGILKLFLPEACGGLGAGVETLVQYSMLLAQYSGALLFLQGQHQFVIRSLSQYPLTDTIHTFFSDIATEQKTVGVFLTAQKKLTSVTKSSDEFRVSGVLPWVSGFNLLEHILISFDYDGQIHYTLIPFKTSQANQGEIRCGDVLPMMVANSVQTVSVTLRDWPVKASELLCSIPVEQRPPAFPHASIYNFAGVAKALLHEAKTSHHFDAPDVQAKYHALEQDWHHYSAAITHPIKENPLVLRTQGLRLARDCSEFARLILAGKALLHDGSVQRLCREVWLYSVTGLNVLQLEAYLSTK